MATQLGVYNGALLELGEATVAATSDPVESARVIGTIYAQVLAECLEAGQWNFAIRTTQEDSDATPSVHDFTYQFTKPSDWVRTAMISANDTFEPPLTRYEDEVSAWYADVDPVYVKYVSDDASYGGDLTIWPALYTRFVEISLARKACRKLSKSDSLYEYLDRVAWPRARKQALSVDAMNGPPRFPPPSSWVRARAGENFRGRRYERA